jgi:hypothetical protein
MPVSRLGSATTREPLPLITTPDGDLFFTDDAGLSYKGVSLGSTVTHAFQVSTLEIESNADTDADAMSSHRGFKPLRLSYRLEGDVAGNSDKAGTKTIAVLRHLNGGGLYAIELESGSGSGTGTGTWDSLTQSPQQPLMLPPGSHSDPQGVGFPQCDESIDLCPSSLNTDSESPSCSGIGSVSVSGLSKLLRSSAAETLDLDRMFTSVDDEEQVDSSFTSSDGRNALVIPEETPEFALLLDRLLRRFTWLIAGLVMIFSILAIPVVQQHLPSPVRNLVMRIGKGFVLGLGVSSPDHSSLSAHIVATVDGLNIKTGSDTVLAASSSSSNVAGESSRSRINVGGIDMTAVGSLFVSETVLTGQ